MTITRIEKDGQPVWQVIFTDEEIIQLVHVIVTGMVGNSQNPIYKILADGIIDRLLGSTLDEASQSMLGNIRERHAPGRFVVDVTTIAREHLKPE